MLSKTKLAKGGVKKFNKTKFQKKLDIAWSIAVRNKAGNKCEVCLSDRFLNAHHIVGRRNMTLRWQLFNGVCLCAGCHTFKLESAHQNPEWFHFWLEDKRWEDLQQVVCTMNTITKWTQEDMEAKLIELKNGK